MNNVIVQLTKREMDMIRLSNEYAKNAFGAPNHLAMIVIAKMARALSDAGAEAMIDKEDYESN